ncbi:MAG: hypothetical protein AAB338_01210, partial [Patescibacteria group bacterium]
TSITTTGSLTVNSASGTAVRFQNGSGTNLFIFDTSNTRFGINSGGAVDTKLDVGGTASVAYFLSSGAVQFASNVASVAYSRFGASTTKRSNYITASNDLLVSGDLETVGSVAFGGTASVSGIFFMTDGQFRPSANSTTAFRFQNAAGSTNVLTIDTTNTRVGVGTTPVTTFEVQGTASASYFIASGSVQFGSNVATASYSRFGGTATTHVGTISTAKDLLISGGLEVNGSTAFDGFVLFGSGASISTNFEVTGSSNRVGINAGGLTDTSFEVGGAASVGTNFNVGENSAATTSVTFETKGATKGVCFVITDSAGTVWYARIVASVASQGKWWITSISCL